MRARGMGAPLAITAVAIATVLAPPAAATAAGENVVKRPGFDIGFALKGSNGYTIAVTSEGHRRVILTARKGLFQSATYSAPGRASSKGIEADFGELGQISVRFDGSARRGEKRGSSPACKGRQTIELRGSVRGTIRFAGERGFTEVDAKRARGSFYRSFRRVCKRPQQAPKPRPPRPPGPKPPSPPSFEFEHSALTAVSTSGGVRHEFFAFSSGFEFGRKGKRETFAITVLGAASHERRGRIAIERSAVEFGDEGAFIVNDPGVYPAVATVTLPKPFSGTATYRQQTRAAQPTWSGSLAVRLPGSEPVALTGEGFRVGLCRTRDERRLTACLRQLAPRLGIAARPLLAQGSGSHSQPFADARLSWSR